MERGDNRMKMIWVMWALVSAIARCQPEGQLTVSATHSIVVIAALQDQEEILSLKAIIDREDIPATALARWCKQHGFLMLPASSREGAAYLFSNRVLRSGAVALQQIMQLLEAGNPIPVVPDNPIYNDLEILVKINESVRLKDLKSFFFTLI